MTTLRSFTNVDYPPDLVKSQAITLIRIRAGRIEFANTVTERREWVNDRRCDDMLFAVWMGQWKADVFEIAES